MKEFLYILDPGKKRDYAAEMIFRDTPEIVPGDATLGRLDRIVHYMDLVHIDKHKGTSYTELVSKVVRRAHTAQLVNNCELLVDGNGVGEPVLDILRDTGLYPIAINSHGGQAVKKVYDEFGKIFQDTGDALKPLKILKEYHVPKADIVDAGRVILQQQRLRIAAGLAYAEDFREQLMDFKPKPPGSRGAVKWEAKHDEIHDDLVICFLMGSWYIINRQDRNEVPERELHTEINPDWNPLDRI